MKAEILSGQIFSLSPADYRSSTSPSPSQPSAFNPKRAQYRYGNYDKYYGYRQGNSEQDARLSLLQLSWLRGKEVLDIGCNTGLVRGRGTQMWAWHTLYNHPTTYSICSSPSASQSTTPPVTWWGWTLTPDSSESRGGTSTGQLVPHPLVHGHTHRPPPGGVLSSADAACQRPPRMADRFPSRWLRGGPFLCCRGLTKRPGSSSLTT